MLPNLALCCFDFSGSGKSQGDCTAYGIKEYKDIGTLSTIKDLSLITWKDRDIKKLYYGEGLWELSLAWHILQNIINNRESVYRY